MLSEKLVKKFSTLKKVLSFVYGKYTIISVSRDFLFIISTASEIYGIRILGKFIDATTDILLTWNSFDLELFLASDSFKYLMITFLLWVVKHLSTQFRSYLYTVIYEKVWSESQAMMISKVASSNLQDVEKKEFQDMLAFAPSFSIGRIVDVYDNFSIILSNIIRLVSSVIILAGNVGPSVILLVVFVIPEALAVHYRRGGIKDYLDESVGKLRFLEYVQNLALTISNFLELRVNNIYNFLKRRYVEEYDEYLAGYYKSQYLFYKTKSVFGVLSHLLKYCYIIYVLAVSIAKKLSFGTFKALYDYVEVAHASITDIFNSLSLVSTNLGYIDKFFDLIEFKGFGDIYHGEKKLSKGTPKLELKNLSFAYPDEPETKVLENINIVVEPGEKVALIGGDGSGKSTAVKILTGLYGVEQGEYLLNGIPTKELNRGELKKKLSIIFQDFINYHFSLRENIVISGQRKRVNNELYDTVIKTAGVNKFKKVVHVDDDSILGKTFPSGKELSPAYWQRLAIARMLYRNKSIFIMDEPFTYIDNKSAEEILDNIFKYLGKEKSLIYLTRNISLLNKFDRIYYFKGGKIVEFGSWDELIKMKGMFYKEFLQQSSNEE
jgi:ABC-type multidrug transport system fused ATPase/permease subunit